MKILEQARAVLVVALLALACVVAVQVSLAIAAVQESQARLEGRADALLAEARARLVHTSQNTNALLIQLGLAADKWRLSSVESVEISRGIARLIREEEQRLARTHQEVDGLLAELRRTSAAGTIAVDRTGEAAIELGRQVQSLGVEGQRTLARSAAVLDQLERLAGDPANAAIQANLVSATGHVDGLTRNTEELMGYLRDVFSPRKRTFWQRVIERLIPRPTVGLTR